MGKISSARDVFINVPFDSDYESLFLSLVAGLTGIGLTPRCVLEIPTNRTRLHRIQSLIKECPYSIHDLSRVQLSNGQMKCPRFNMPFELGLAVSYAISGKKRHDWAILEAKEYRIQKTLSDLNGFDPYIHNGRPKTLLRQLLNIFKIETGSRPELSGLESNYKNLIKAVKRLKEEKVISSIYERDSFHKLVFLGRKFSE